MKRLRFLVVDDCDLVREITKAILESIVDVETANCGRESVNRFKETVNTKDAFDVILMDIEMPNLDGIDALKEIRQIEKELGMFPPNETKIIMVSALMNHMAIIESLKYGKANSYIVKPIEINELISELHKLGIELKEEVESWNF